MPEFQAVSKAAFADKRWKRYDSYQFAAHDAVAPLVVQELPRAMLHLPIGFIKQQDSFVLVAVLGLRPEQNLFVAPDGRWIGGYTPAAYRGYPFVLANATEGETVLAFDTDSGLLSESDGECFFDESGEPAKPVKDVLDFLGQVQANRLVTERICAALDAYQLIQPWPVSVQGGQGEYKLDGLYRIDEALLNELSADDLHALRQAGGLPVAYCQLLSIQHLQALDKLSEAHAKVDSQSALPVSDNGELDLEFLNNSGTISFN